jgi:DNA replication protein DnaC
MSEPEEKETRTPIDHAALREHSARLRQDADDAWRKREEDERIAMLADIATMATRQLEAFRDLPCKGEVAHIGACSTDFADKCERRKTPSCPRNIVAYDEQKRLDSERERMTISGVPADIRRVLTTCYEPTESTQAVDAWIASGERLLLLAGTFGTGKSVAAGYAISRCPGRWMHASEIAKVGRLDADERYRELQSARLLVIDDIGSEYNDASGWGKSTLTALLLTRYEEGLRSILTCNLDGKAWKQYADMRILDRLAGDGTVFGAVGKSRRR